MIEIIAPGPLCTVQDDGRHGWAYLGVGHSGAADRPAYALANRLVGNVDGAAALECTFGGLSFRVRDACVIAVAGAPCDVEVSAGVPIGHQHPVAVPANTVVTLRAPREGLRTYISFRGGLDVDPVMGSRSTDTLSGIGPPPLVAGAVLAVGADPGTPIPTEPAPPRPMSTDPIRLWPGPRHDWFSAEALHTLEAVPFTVQSSSNRVGVRLAGPVIARRIAGDLPSEGLVEGAVQVPADGQPLIFLADHGTTGGYPVIAIVDAASLPQIAQARPGHPLTFRWR